VTTSQDIGSLWNNHGQPVLDWVQDNAQPVLFGAGAAGAILMAALAWRYLRHGETHAKLGVLAVTLATAFAMEGMFEVANGPLGLNVAGSLMFCATFEIVMLHQGTLAAHKLKQDPDCDIRRHMTFVWIVAGASGVIASTASDSVTEVALRLATPPLAAGIWYMSLYADRAPAERQESQWIWTPQRIGVHLGLLKPGSADNLNDVFRVRRVARMVRVAGQLDTAGPRRKARLARKLTRLAQSADAQMLAQARAGFLRGATAQDTILGRAPMTQDAQPDDAQPAHTDAPRSDAQSVVFPQVARGDARAMTRVDAAPLRRGQVVMRRPDDAPEDPREAAFAQAIDAVLTQRLPLRQAARDAGVPEATLRNRLKKHDTNGHSLESAAA